MMLFLGTTLRASQTDGHKDATPMFYADHYGVAASITIKNSRLNVKFVANSTYVYFWCTKLYCRVDYRFPIL